MPFRNLLFVVLILCMGRIIAAGAEDAQSKKPSNPFFALCFDIRDAKQRGLAEQAEMLDELGYDGAGHVGLDGLPERLKTLDAKGLKLFQLYLHVSIDPARQPCDPGLNDALPLLAKRETMLVLLVGGGKPSDTTGDERAVEIIRQIADLAKPHGLRVTLYPHADNWLERVEDAVRVAKKVQRKNVGVMFNLCHWLKVDDAKNLRPLLKSTGTYLFAVSINGADAEAGHDAGWDRLIQPLDCGTFDVAVLLRRLKELGYNGPIGLQCYGISGDARDHLKRSIRAWRRLTATINAD